MWMSVVPRPASQDAVFKLVFASPALQCMLFSRWPSLLTCSSSPSAFLSVWLGPGIPRLWASTSVLRPSSRCAIALIIRFAESSHHYQSQNLSARQHKMGLFTGKWVFLALQGGLNPRKLLPLPLLDTGMHCIPLGGDNYWTNMV